MRQSVSIIIQCLSNMPGGSISAASKEVPPARKTIKSSMEGLIQHFK